MRQWAQQIPWTRAFMESAQIVEEAAELLRVNRKWTGENGGPACVGCGSTQGTPPFVRPLRVQKVEAAGIEPAEASDPQHGVQTIGQSLLRPGALRRLYGSGQLLAVHWAASASAWAGKRRRTCNP